MNIIMIMRFHVYISRYERKTERERRGNGALSEQPTSRRAIEEQISNTTAALKPFIRPSLPEHDD